MAKTKPIGVRFDEELLTNLKNAGLAESPQKALNLFERSYMELIRLKVEINNQPENKKRIEDERNAVKSIETPQISTQLEASAEQGKEKKVENSQPNEQIQPRNFHEYLIAAKIGVENVDLFKEWVSGDKKLTAGQKSMIISKL